MLEFVGILLFALVIGLSIALHELGHLLPAKAFGVKVTEYMIGFGPKVWSKTVGETRYGLKLIPLGGYIRMIGMIPPARAGESDGRSGGRFAAMIADARRASLEEVGPGDADRVFYRLPVRKRILIMMGGPTMNLVMAFVLFAIVLVGIGLPQPSMRVAALVACTPSLAHPTGEPLPSGNCPEGTSPAPGVAAGLAVDDAITAVDGRPATSWSDVTDWIWAHPGSQVTLTVDRAGTPHEVPVTVASINRPVVDDSGNETEQTVPSGFIGIRPAFEYVPQPWSSVPAYMWDLTRQSVQALIGLPISVFDLVSQTLIGGQDRPVNGPVSVVGVSRLGGEIAAMDEPLAAKAATFLGLAASLNLFLFLFNLLPVVPLDGGHVASALYEAIRRSWAKLRHRPDPGPVDTARLLPLTYAVAAVLIAMGLIVIWADLVKPISFG